LHPHPIDSSIDPPIGRSGASRPPDPASSTIMIDAGIYSRLNPLALPPVEFLNWSYTSYWSYRSYPGCCHPLPGGGGRTVLRKVFPSSKEIISPLWTRVVFKTPHFCGSFGINTHGTRFAYFSASRGQARTGLFLDRSALVRRQSAAGGRSC
jgi:hypothetical protein